MRKWRESPAADHGPGIVLSDISLACVYYLVPFSDGRRNDNSLNLFQFRAEIVFLSDIAYSLS